MKLLVAAVNFAAVFCKTSRIATTTAATATTACSSDANEESLQLFQSPETVITCSIDNPTINSTSNDTATKMELLPSTSGLPTVTVRATAVFAIVIQ